MKLRSYLRKTHRRYFVVGAHSEDTSASALQRKCTR